MAAYRADFIVLTQPPHVGYVVIPVYLCPSETHRQGGGSELQWGLTSYLGVSGTVSQSRRGVLFSQSAVSLTDITDGTSQTLMVGERPPDSNLALGMWYYGGYGVGGDVDPGMGNNFLGVRESVPISALCPQGTAFHEGRINDRCDDFHFWSLHSGGANFCFADASVHFLPYSIDRSVLEAMSTRAQGEPAALQW